MIKSRYLQFAFWDFVLCWVMASALGLTLQVGFEVSESVLARVVWVVVAAGLLAILYAAGSSRERLGPFIGLYVGASIAVVVVAALTSYSETLASEQVGNNVIPAIVMLLTVPAVYAATRTTPGVGIALVVGFVLCAAIQFLYREFFVVADIAYVLSGVAMVAYRNHAKALRTASLAGRASYASGFALSLGVAGVLVALASVAFFALVAPLNPQGAELKLIQEYRRLPEVHVSNEVAVSEEIDFSLLSSRTDDMVVTTSDLKEGPDGIPYPTESEVAPDQAGLQSLDGVYQDLEVNSEDEVFDLIDYGSSLARPWWILIILGLIAAAVAAGILAKRHQRKKWYSWVQGLDPAERVNELYCFFVSRFAALGFGKEDTVTVSEYAEGQKRLIDSFAQAHSPVSFSALTDAFLRATYGREAPSGDEMRNFEDYYQAFYKNCRSYLGNLGYARKYFAL